MGFVKTSDEIAGCLIKSVEFYNAEMLSVFFETKLENIQHLLPPPLRPTGFPLCAAFVADYPATNFSLPYKESGLMLAAEYGGKNGLYTLAMVVDNDMALIEGRETLGYPKKMGNINLVREGADFKCSTERHEILFMEIKARLGGSFNDRNVQDMIIENIQSDPDLTVYNFKHFAAPALDGFDYNPRLVKEIIQRKIKSFDMGEAQLVFNPSPHDPWSDVDIVKVFGAMYTVSDFAMLPGEVVAEADPVEFMPFAFMKLDDFSR